MAAPNVSTLSPFNQVVFILRVVCSLGACQLNAQNSRSSKSLACLDCAERARFSLSTLLIRFIPWALESLRMFFCFDVDNVLCEVRKGRGTFPVAAVIQSR